MEATVSLAGPARLGYGYSIKSFTGGNAAACANGFPTRLVYRVLFPAGPSTRLIPEMTFTCTGVITGFTAALKEQRGLEDPKIQVWRKNMSQPDSYYKINPDIAVDNAHCVGGLNEVSSEVFHCILNQTTARVTVQPGDILGLEIPRGGSRDVDIQLGFAQVSRGPTNYVFTMQGLPLSSPAALSNSDLVSYELPQITLEIESGRCSYNNYSISVATKPHA